MICILAKCGEKRDRHADKMTLGLLVIVRRTRIPAMYLAERTFAVLSAREDDIAKNKSQPRPEAC